MQAEEESARAAQREYLARITHRPRVVFDGSVVLRRRQWVVPLALLPQRSTDESALDFFLRVNRWREQHGIPREVYARLEPVYAPAPAAGEARAAEEGAEAAAPEPGPVPRRIDRASLNNLKPQYVDFASPLLAGVFGHMAPETGSYSAVLVERYPDAAGLPEVGGERFAAEQVIQIDLAHDPHR
jgi:hypothetical protein